MSSPQRSASPEDKPLSLPKDKPLSSPQRKRSVSPEPESPTEHPALKRARTADGYARAISTLGFGVADNTTPRLEDKKAALAEQAKFLQGAPPETRWEALAAVLKSCSDMGEIVFQAFDDLNIDRSMVAAHAEDGNPVLLLMGALLFPEIPDEHDATTLADTRRVLRAAKNMGLFETVP
jgi:hypothetical protein